MVRPAGQSEQDALLDAIERAQAAQAREEGERLRIQAARNCCGLEITIVASTILCVGSFVAAAKMTPHDVIVSGLPVALFWAVGAVSGTAAATASVVWVAKHCFNKFKNICN